MNNQLLIFSNATPGDNFVFLDDEGRVLFSIEATGTPEDASRVNQALNYEFDASVTILNHEARKDYTGTLDIEYVDADTGELESREVSYAIAGHFPAPVVDKDTSWVETHHEIVAGITRALDRPENPESHIWKRHNEQGTGGIYELAEDLTNEFQKATKDHEWDGEFFEAIEAYIDHYDQTGEVSVNPAK